MDLDAFEATLRQRRLPADLTGPLRALWLGATGDWDGAHAVVQHDPSREASWVHAWLHREEGDLPNADYWYRRAGTGPCRGDLRGEWRAIVAALLNEI